MASRVRKSTSRKQRINLGLAHNKKPDLGPVFLCLNAVSQSIRKTTKAGQLSGFQNFARGVVANGD